MHHQSIFALQILNRSLTEMVHIQLCMVHGLHSIGVRTWDLAWHDVLNMFRVHGSSQQPTPKLVTHLSLKRSVIRCQRLRANFLILVLDTESNDHMDQSVELLSASDFFPTSKSPLRNCYFFTVFYEPKKQPSWIFPRQKKNIHQSPTKQASYWQAVAPTLDMDTKASAIVVLRVGFIIQWCQALSGPYFLGFYLALGGKHPQIPMKMMKMSRIEGFCSWFLELFFGSPFFQNRNLN